jgi:hypothetical protein
LTLFLATALGVPVSTTHAITGAIGYLKAARRGRLFAGMSRSGIVIAWLLTLPAAGLLAPWPSRRSLLLDAYAAWAARACVDEVSRLPAARGGARLPLRSVDFCLAIQHVPGSLTDTASDHDSLGAVEKPGNRSSVGR